MSMTKKALYALKAKGVDICGDLRIVGENDLYIGDGSALTSMVKDAEFMELFVDGAGEPNFDGNGSNVDAGLGKKAFMKITRNWGDVVYKSVKGADDLVAPDDMDGVVESLPEVKAELDKLEAAVASVVSSMRIGAQIEVSKLDDSFDAFLVELQANLEQVKTEILRHASARDLILAAAGEQRVQATEECYETRMSRDRFCVTATVSEVIGANGTFSIDAKTLDTSSGSGSIDSERSKVENWDVRVLLHKTGEDEHLRSAAIPHTMYVGGDKLSFNLSMEQCADHVIGQDKIVITGVYAGPLSEIDTECSTARDAIAPDYSAESHTPKVFDVVENDDNAQVGDLARSESRITKIQNPA